MPLIEIDPVDYESWLQWKQNPVTRQAVAGLLNKRSNISEDLLEGICETNDQRMAAIGRCQALRDAVIYLIEDFDYIEKEAKENAEGMQNMPDEKESN